LAHSKIGRTGELIEGKRAISGIGRQSLVLRRCGEATLTDAQKQLIFDVQRAATVVGVVLETARPAASER